MLDIPTGVITDTYPVTGTSSVHVRTGSVTAGHVAWVAPASSTTVVVGTRATGDVAGTRIADVVARDRSGVLWLYQGAGAWGRGAFLGRVRVGGGWQAYDRLAGGSDVTGDGRSDLLATDKSGVLWVYPGTGNAKAPFSARKRVGGGWGTYNHVTAVGNIGGAKAGDLVARDRAGVLWLYLGKGDGSFAERVRIGGGWSGYGHLVGIGDANRDGRPDLLASRGGGETTFYAGTGDWRSPFKTGPGGSVLSWHSGHDEVFWRAGPT
ncbi:FG-GAP repeat domain-containing protein [Streptomyces sp. NPDC050842]|uniref:FG-GAP repeat domain-containing protein n=1 Tax=Streptomyces sp. NPDC050842 TaxID=3365636 RepID=UPI003799F324